MLSSACSCISLECMKQSSLVLFGQV
uniref:Uncharacterized protein n=1 Tax=Arundo donax TaxID=35708 RepID=A0A0A8XVG0_ARUDO